MVSTNGGWIHGEKPNITSAAAAASINSSWSKAQYQSHATYKLRAIYTLCALHCVHPRNTILHCIIVPKTVVHDALGILSSIRGPSALANGALTKLDYNKFASKVVAL